MKRNTSISNDLQHTTKFIDPRSGKVLKEGTTPMSTVGAFKTNPQPTVEDTNRMDKIESDMSEIKELLKGLTKK